MPAETFDHASLSGLQLHDVFHYVQSSDPGTVGADKLWLDTSGTPYLIKRRNAGNTAWVLCGDGNTGGGGGGDSTTTGDYASRPSAGNDGNLYFPNDGVSVDRDNGSIWQPWGPLYPLTAPVDGDYSWINQGSATVTAGGGAIYLHGTAQSGVNAQMRVKSAPSTPYTITALVLPRFYWANSNGCGIGFRQSSDGKLALCRLFINSSNFGLESTKYTSATALSAAYVTRATPPGLNHIFLRISDNGTNRIVSYSMDGRNFETIHTVSRTDFLTADQVGFFVDSQNASFAASMTLASWKQA
jgi:hypothetical protein